MGSVFTRGLHSAADLIRDEHARHLVVEKVRMTSVPKGQYADQDGDGGFGEIEETLERIELVDGLRHREHGAGLFFLAVAAHLGLEVGSGGVRRDANEDVRRVLHRPPGEVHAAVQARAELGEPNGVDVEDVTAAVVVPAVVEVIAVAARALIMTTPPDPSVFEGRILVIWRPPSLLL